MKPVTVLLDSEVQPLVKQVAFEGPIPEACRRFFIDKEGDQWRIKARVMDQYGEAVCELSIVAISEQGNRLSVGHFAGFLSDNDNAWAQGFQGRLEKDGSLCADVADCWANVALTGSAQQSSIDAEKSYGPNLAIDGRNRAAWEGGSTRTKLEKNPFWELNLPKPDRVQALSIWSRTGSCDEGDKKVDCIRQLDGAEVLFYDDYDQLVAGRLIEKAAAVQVFTFTQPVEVKRIRIRHPGSEEKRLEIAEVEMWHPSQFLYWGTGNRNFDLLSGSDFASDLLTFRSEFPADTRLEILETKGGLCPNFAIKKEGNGNRVVSLRSIAALGHPGSDQRKCELKFRASTPSKRQSEILSYQFYARAAVTMSAGPAAGHAINIQYCWNNKPALGWLQHVYREKGIPTDSYFDYVILAGLVCEFGKIRQPPEDMREWDAFYTTEVPETSNLLKGRAVPVLKDCEGDQNYLTGATMLMGNYQQVLDQQVIEFDQKCHRLGPDGLQSVWQGYNPKLSKLNVATLECPWNFGIIGFGGRAHQGLSQIKIVCAEVD